MPFMGLHLKNVGKLQLVQDFIYLFISEKASLGNTVYNAATKLLDGMKHSHHFMSALKDLH